MQYKVYICNIALGSRLPTVHEGKDEADAVAEQWTNLLQAEFGDKVKAVAMPYVEEEA